MLVQDSVRYRFPRTAAHGFTEIFNREMNVPHGLCVRQAVKVEVSASCGCPKETHEGVLQAIWHTHPRTRASPEQTGHHRKSQRRWKGSSPDYSESSVKRRRSGKWNRAGSEYIARHACNSSVTSLKSSWSSLVLTIRSHSSRIRSSSRREGTSLSCRQGFAWCHTFVTVVGKTALGSPDQGRS